MLLLHKLYVPPDRNVNLSVRSLFRKQLVIHLIKEPLYQPYLDIDSIDAQMCVTEGINKALDKITI